MSGGGWAWAGLLALGVLALGSVLVALVISARRGRAAGYRAGHARGRRGHGGDHR